jgi:predicted HicB family RNase H-like nuclease
MTSTAARHAQVKQELIVSHDEVKQEQAKQEEIRSLAEGLTAIVPDWVTFYREVLGLQGIVRRNYPTQEALAGFQQSEACCAIQQMLSQLRKRRRVFEDPDEPMKVITVRIPKSLHDALWVEAHEHCTSINKLCVSKLVQYIDRARVPSDH